MAIANGSEILYYLDCFKFDEYKIRIAQGQSYE